MIDLKIELKNNKTMRKNFQWYQKVQYMEDVTGFHFTQEIEIACEHSNLDADRIFLKALRAEHKRRGIDGAKHYVPVNADYLMWLYTGIKPGGPGENFKRTLT